MRPGNLRKHYGILMGSVVQRMNISCQNVHFTQAEDIRLKPGLEGEREGLWVRNLSLTLPIFHEHFLLPPGFSS